MREDVLGVFEPLDHLEVAALHCRVQRVGVPFTALVDVRHHLGLAAEHDLSVVLEIDLHHFVAQAEHNGMARAHPLLHVDHVDQLMRFFGRVDCDLLICPWFVASLQVGAEMLEKRDFLLQIFGVLC